MLQLKAKKNMLALASCTLFVLGFPGKFKAKRCNSKQKQCMLALASCTLLVLGFPLEFKAKPMNAATQAKTMHAGTGLMHSVSLWISTRIQSKSNECLHWPPALCLSLEIYY